jgi:hypothetical protein
MPDNAANINGQKIPDAIRSFLMSKEVIEKRIAVLDENDISPSDSIKLGRLLNRLYQKEIGLSDFFFEIKILAKNDENAAKKIMMALLRDEFIVVSGYLDGVEAFISSLGGNPAEFTATRIVIRDVTPSDLVAEILHEHPVNVPAHLEHRLREILESRVRGVRKDDETVMRLTRAEKIGGAELPREEAEKIVEALAAKVASVKIVSDNETTPAVLAPTPIIVDAKSSIESAPIIPTTNDQRLTTKPNASSSTKSGHGIMPEDEHEVNIIREKVLPNVLTPTVSSRDEDIKSALEAVVDATNVALSVAMLERYKAIVASRLKGVRDPAETRELLMREPARGGMGFFASDVEAALSAIEKQVETVNGKREEALKNEKNDFVKQSVNETFAKDESRKKGELEDIDRMYGSLTGKFSKTPAPISLLPPSSVPTTANQKPTTPSPALPKASVPIAEKTIVVPSPFVAAPVKTPAPIFQTPTVQPAPRPAPAPIVSPVPSPKMQDIRPVTPAARLTGPVQELADLTLADFRRLSADPVEACRKLSDKLDILEEHSYARRIEGIKAWQDSQVNRMYLGVINAAFSGGKPLGEAVSEALNAGRETLTEREVRAIMELNKQLKA